MAPKSKTIQLWNPYETFDVFPNTRSFQCLDSRCWDSVDGKDTKAACACLDEMALKHPSRIGEKSLAGLAVLCFCSRHREDHMHEGEILEKVFEWQDRIKDVLEESDKESEGEMEEQEYESGKESEGEMEEEQVYESGKENEGEMEEMQEEEREVAQLLDEVNELKEQLQRTVDENGMLEQQIAADEQRSREKQTTMSKKITQLQRQVFEVEGANKDVELVNLAKTLYAREGWLERELERINKIATCSREVKIKEVNAFKIQLQDSGAQVEEAARHIEDLKGQLEESNARMESMERETAENIRELKGQHDRERGITMELDELTTQLKESNAHLEESNTRLTGSNTLLEGIITSLGESNTRLKGSNAYLEVNNTYLEESNTRLEEINTNLGESNTRLEESNICLEESNTRLEESNTRLKESNTRLKESNTRLKESKSHHEVMEQQTSAEIDKLRDQLDKSNTSLEDMRQGSINEASELKDQLTRCKDIIAELKAAETANIVQCEADKSKNVLEDCQTENACDIAGSQHSIDSDDAVEQLMAASSHEKNQSIEEVHGLKEKLCDGKAASTMPTSVLHTEFQNLRMWTQFSLRSSYVELLFKQRKVEQAGTANPALLDEVLRLREQARDVDRRLASQIEKISVLKPGDVNRGVGTL